MNYPKVTKIIKTIEENPYVKTFFFKYPQKVKPGQFFMIWIPNVDEIPMSASYIKDDIKGITFKQVGDATKSLFKLKKDDKIGIRGPYGKNFKITDKNILLVGGGTGIATLGPTVEEATKKGINTTVILGAKNKKELFFENRFKKYGAKVYISTDDGSKGYKGLATDLAKKLLNENKYSSILTCGPEKMMKRLLELSKNIPFQASLERYMKCGFGICGQCCIDEGIRVCEDGPIFDGKTLKNIQDFGVYKRDAAGRKIKF